MEIKGAHQEEVRPSPSSRPRLWPVYWGQTRNPETSRRFSAACWLSDSEERLKNVLRNHMNYLLKIAARKIVLRGYSREAAASSLLRLALSYNESDTTSLIVDSALQHLRHGSSSDPPLFDDLEQLQSYILAEMVCVMKIVRPLLSTADAMWCLLLGDLNLYQAAIDLPAKPLAQSQKSIADLGSTLFSLIRTARVKTKKREQVDERPVPDEAEREEEEEMPSTSYSVSSASSSSSRFSHYRRKKQNRTKNNGRNRRQNVNRNAGARAPRKEEREQEREEEDRDRFAAIDFCKSAGVDLQQREKEMKRMTKEWKEWGEERISQAERSLDKEAGELQSLRKTVIIHGEHMANPVVERMTAMNADVEKFRELARRWSDLTPWLEAENVKLMGEVEDAAKERASRNALKKAEDGEREKVELQRELRKATNKYRQIQQEISKTEDYCRSLEERCKEEERKKMEAISQCGPERVAEREGMKEEWRWEERILSEYLEKLKRRQESKIEKLWEEQRKMKKRASSSPSSSSSSSSSFPREMEFSAKGRGRGRGRAGRRKKRTRWECAVCRREEVAAVMVPCGHQELCAWCSVEEEDEGREECSWCGEAVQERILARFGDE